MSAADQPAAGPRPDLGTPARNELRDRLLRAGAFQIAEAYEGAVAVLSQPALPSRHHLLAHLVRDIANRLPEVLGTPDQGLPFFDTTAALDELAEVWTKEVREPSPFATAEVEPAPAVTLPAPLVAQVSRLIRDHERVASGRRDEFALLMEALRPGSLALRPAIEPIIGDWANLVRWFVGQAHVRAKPTTAPSEEELTRRFENFEYGLRGLLDGHFEVVREIDAILDGPGTVEEKLARVKPFLAGAEQLRRFFERLDDPAWLKPLAEGGFFATSPAAVVHTHSGGTSTRWPEWPASKWLLRMASRPELQAELVDVADGIPSETDNPWVRRDVADIALAVEPEHGVRLAKRLRTWMCEHPSRAPRDWSDLDEKVPLLAVRLAAADKRKPAREIARDLLRAKGPRDDVWQFRSVLPARARDLATHLGLWFLTEIRGALAAEFAAERRDGVEPGGSDDLTRRFPPLFDDSTPSAAGALAEALVDAASTWIRAESTRWSEAVEHIEAGRWLVFRRVVLALLAREPDAPVDLIAARLLDRRLFDAFDGLREYRLLLHHGFARLDAADRERLLGWVNAGPEDSTDERERLARWLGREATDDDVRREARRWRWRRLTVIAGDLPPAEATTFAGLVSDFGQRTADEVIADPFGAPRVVVPVGREPAPKTPDELLASLAAAVDASDPATVALRLWDLKFDGVRKRQRVPWHETLVLAQRGLALVSPDTRPAYDPRIALAELLESALSAVAIPAEQRDLIWALIQPLTRSPEAAMRARAVVLAVLYRSWVVRATMAGYRDGQPRPDLSAPEVCVALDEVLDAAATPECHAAFGEGFGDLATFEREWLRARVPRLFPLDAAGEELRHAAWDAFLDRRGRFSLSGLPAQYTFELLRGVYEYEVEHMKMLPMSGRERLGGSEPERERAERLAEHLVWMWADGTLTRCDAEGLVDRLFAKGDGRLREYALRCLGRLLGEDGRLASIPGAVERSKALWQRRREAAERDERWRDELPGFGPWFISEAFEDDWALDQLLFVIENARRREDDDPASWGPVDRAHEVLKRLGHLADRHPQRVMACFAALAHRVQSSIGFSAGPDEIRTILGVGLRSDDKVVRDDALAAFHRLGDLGFRAREIVPISDDLDDPAAIAYFTWDHPMTVAEVRRRLTEGSEPERHRMLGQILREAKPPDVWKFTTPEQVHDLWPHVEKHLGRRRGMWEALFAQWKEQGLLAD